MQISLLARTVIAQERHEAILFKSELAALLQLPEEHIVIELTERPALDGGGVDFKTWTGATIAMQMPEGATGLVLDHEDADREMARRLLRAVAVTARDAAEGTHRPFRLESVRINFTDHRALAEDSIISFD